jgi:cytochrome c oxidase assembly protein subunit 15
MTTDNGQRTREYLPWLHRWAVLTVCATFILLLLGAVVTTFRVGMADPIWPTYPWHLLLASWDEPRPGFLIEHSHRLAGYLVGCCVIVLTVWVWRTDSRSGVRWLGLAALLGVIIQGLLGGFRVKLDRILGSDLALIHGCFAQIVFGMLVGLAVVTSRGRVQSTSMNNSVATRFRRVSLATVILVYVQIIFGALFRHTFSTWGPRGHLLIAFAVVVATSWLVKEALDQQIRDLRVLVPVLCLGALLAVQLFLGVEAWMVRMTAVDRNVQAIIRTSHVLVGSLIFAAAIATCLQAYAHAMYPKSDFRNRDEWELGKGEEITVSQVEEVAV